MIDFIICYLASLAFQPSAIYLYYKLSKRKIELNYKIILIIALSTLIQVIIILWELGFLGPLFTILYFYYFFQTISDAPKIEARNYSIIIWVLSMLIDLSFMTLGATFDLIKYYETNELLYRLVASLLMCGILIILAHTKWVVKVLNKLEQKMEKLKVKFIREVIVVILFLLVGLFSIRSMGNQVIVTTNFLIGALIIGLLIRKITLQFEVMTLKKTNEILEKNDEVNRKIITECRVLKHNLKGQLMGVKTVANEEAKELLNDIIQKHDNSFYMKQDINSIPSGINGLIFEKLYAYKRANLKIEIKNEIKGKLLDKIGARSYNLFCEAIGVTLDNALESAKKSKEKLLYIEFKEKEEQIEFNVVNTFKGFIDLEKLGTIEYTSKEKGHGIGLFSLIGKKNLTLTTKIKNNLFINTISVNKLKK